MTASSVVYVVDDEASVRRGVTRLLRSAGYAAEPLESAESFLALKKPSHPCCLVLDLQMPGLNGLELQQVLAARGMEIPIIFVSGHGDVPASVRAMKAGAIDFLTKPFDEKELLGAIEHAIEEGRRLRLDQLEQRKVSGRAHHLTDREREVAAQVVKGLLNKQIAGRLKISEKTVKVHRARAMQKMRAGSLAELVRLWEKLSSAS